MDNITKGWKVVRKRGNRYFSVAHISELEYWEGKWTERPNKDDWGPLTCFKTLEAAVSFAKDHLVPATCAVIWQCSYVPNEDEKRVWYMSKYEAGMYLPRIFLPEGTVLADAIRLDERVDIRRRIDE